MDRRHTIVCLGEILWDIFPNGRKLGGAPANFAYASSLLGERAVIASRVGEDDLGQEVRHELSRSGLEATHIQSDPACPTGTVTVSVDSAGQASFAVNSPAAWDFFQPTPGWTQLAEKADAVCFGTLAQRSPESRQTIEAFLSSTRSDSVRVLDVNLRQSFYSATIIARSAELCQIIKLNSQELPIVLSLLGASFVDEISAARWLLKTFQLQLVCVTRASQGSLLLASDGYDEHPGIPVKVVDTVGAGDAFTAALVYHFLRSASLQTMNLAANRMGTWVASQSGAMPAASGPQLESIRFPEKAFQSL